jgi:DNA-binding NarL/FixJ family response regulator
MSTTTVAPHPGSISAEFRPPAATGVGVLMPRDDAWLRSRVSRLLETEPGLLLAWAVDSGEDAKWMAEHEPVDVVVVGHWPRSLSGLWLCHELKQTATPPAVVICSAYPDAVLAACCVVVEVDALVSRYDCDAELSVVLRRVRLGARVLPAVPPRVGAMLHERLDASENAIFSPLLAGIPAANVATELRMSQPELKSRRSALLGKLVTLPPASGSRY